VTAKHKKQTGTAKKVAEEEPESWTDRSVREWYEMQERMQLAREVLRKARSLGQPAWHEEFQRAGVTNIFSTICDLERDGSSIEWGLAYRGDGARKHIYYRMLVDREGGCDD
jgi:hypothetical protein